VEWNVFLEKLIFTFELFSIYFQLFFSFCFSFQLVEFFLDKLNCLLCYNFCGKLFGIFLLLQHLSTRLKVFACGWKVLGTIDFMLLTSYFGTEFGPIMFNFKLALKNLMRKRSHTPFPHPGAVISCGGGAVRAGSPEEGGPSGGILSQNSHFSEKKSLNFFYRKT
jgi:hypothetical protein